MCGHATVAALGRLHELGLLHDCMKGKLQLKAATVRYRIEPPPEPTSPFEARSLRVSRGEVKVFMEQLPLAEDPPLSDPLAARLADALGLKGTVRDAMLEADFRPRIASTGLRDLFCAMPSTEDLAAIQPDMELLTVRLSPTGVFVCQGAGRVKRGQVCVWRVVGVEG